MNANQQGPYVGEILKALLKERSLSMRKLSALTGIDTAIISRIINGKQKAKMDHLHLFAVHLGIPSERLFQAAGLETVSPSAADNSELHASVDSIKEVLLSYNLFDSKFTTEQVRKELTKYEQYALTEEGRRIIIEDFQAKVDSVNSAGPFIDELRQMYELFGKEDLSTEKRAILGSALLYFILSTDIIPDYVFPIGYLDDAIAVQIVLERLSQQDTKT
ncbi:DUF1232 domain-containing protein [Paenibacillus sp. OAS669]|uniref:DUF1232 domain-containing protein n=1 Tax=Paenibacillus sp. OAS669 TaxID=2663821 RepID=UPI00178AD2EE|nr:DUF1232 domain-containing protein [Paenibacillus sp. OAS669]MBE1443401.1 uncharacterized membrane protein YkvA (DUF1232 family)/predicted XRE-type DNA-binding protein [Paenibacillus sp. OAS669]